MINKASNRKDEITLIALVVTVFVHYLNTMKASGSKGFDYCKFEK